MLEKLLLWLARGHRCRNTRLEIDIDRRPEQPDWLQVTMVDKCTKARYEATFSPESAERVLTRMRDIVGKLG